MLKQVIGKTNIYRYRINISPLWSFSSVWLLLDVRTLPLFCGCDIKLYNESDVRRVVLATAVHGIKFTKEFEPVKWLEWLIKEDSVGTTLVATSLCQNY